MNEVIFWGATGQAKVLRECLNESARLIALFDVNSQVVSPFLDVPLFYGRDAFENWLRSRGQIEELHFLVAIGGDKGKERVEIQSYLEGRRLRPLTALHRTAFVAGDTVVGPGSQILAQAAVCSAAQIGRACIINTAATVDHECRLGDGVHVAPGAHLAGCVRVENYAMIGTGAIILPRLTIGESAIVGAGAVVVKSVMPNTVVAGNPARVLRTLP
jgi:sugar O-acyltransferase (sialic acid O-acetyltransferase NeuD family)